MKARYIARAMYIILMIGIYFLPISFRFTLLNMTLAYIPLELAFLLKLFVPSRSYEWPLFILFSMILIFMFPNTFYMLTDLIHLNQFNFSFFSGLVLFEWINFTALIITVMFAMYCYVLVMFEMNQLPFSKWVRSILMLFMMILNGLGVFVGRFLRFHSVHLINHPLNVIQTTVESINMEALLFIMMMVLLQCFLLLCVKGVRMRS